MAKQPKKGVKERAQDYKDRAVNLKITPSGIAVGAGGVAAIATNVDAFTGDVNVMNAPYASVMGEQIQNALVGGLALGSGAFTGAAIAQATGKPMRDVRNEVRANNANIDKEQEGLKNQMKDIQKNKGETAAKQFFSDNKERMGSEYKRNTKKEGQRRIVGEYASGMDQRTMRASAIGAAAALVPTLLSMRDKQVLAEQSSSLM